MIILNTSNYSKLLLKIQNIHQLFNKPIHGNSLYLATIKGYDYYFTVDKYNDYQEYILVSKDNLVIDKVKINIHNQIDLAYFYQAFEN